MNRSERRKMGKQPAPLSVEAKLAFNSKGIDYFNQEKFEDAISAFKEASRLMPGVARVHYNLGTALAKLGRLDQAILSFRKTVALDPSHADAHFSEALAHLTHGDFAAGLSKYERRLLGGVKGVPARSFAQPKWAGEDIAGRTILLHAEQGLGDTIQFCRYVQRVAERGARVIFDAPGHMLRLLKGVPGVYQFVATGEPLPAFDLHCPLMSLPYLFGTRLESIPPVGVCISAEQASRDLWATRIGAHGFKIGIAWQGNPTAPVESGRSAPLASFAPLASVPGVRLISLQKKHGLDQLNTLPPGMQVETLGDDFDSGADAFIDTAGVMMNLDLVITVDTATGHLAGALGRPVWLALQVAPHWVWMMNRSDSPWYSSVRLFRQTEYGHWGDVFTHMAEALPR